MQYDDFIGVMFTTETKNLEVDFGGIETGNCYWCWPFNLIKSGGR